MELTLEGHMSSGSGGFISDSAGLTTQNIALDPAEVQRAARVFFEYRVTRGLPGDAESDWLQAERWLKTQKIFREGWVFTV